MLNISQWHLWVYCTRQWCRFFAYLALHWHQSLAIGWSSFPWGTGAATHELWCEQLGRIRLLAQRTTQDRMRERSEKVSTQEIGNVDTVTLSPVRWAFRSCDKVDFAGVTSVGHDWDSSSIIVVINGVFCLGNTPCSIMVCCSDVIRH